MSLDFSSLRQSIASLERALELTSSLQKDSSQYEVMQAGVIQNFEFTYELCWKFMKRWLKINISDSAIDGMSRKELFRLAAESQLIDNIENWFVYHKARNETAHTYNIETANDVYLVANKFSLDAKNLLLALECKND